MLDRWQSARVFLYRHGETMFHGTNRVAGGLVDAELNDKGRHQAVLLARRTDRHQVVEVHSSPLTRALDTAAPSAIMQGLEPVVIFPELRERSFGADIEFETDDRRLIDVRAELGRFWRLTPKERLQERLVSDMETDAELLARVERYLTSQQPGTTVMAATHWDVISTLTLYRTNRLYSPLNIGGIVVDVNPKKIEVVSMADMKLVKKHARLPWRRSS